METTERLWANDDSRAAVEDRVTFFCEITETEPPKLSFRNGKLMATDALFDWIKREGVSLDWLTTGDPRCMIRVFRRDEQNRSRFAAQIAQMDKQEKEALSFILRAVVEKAVRADEAFPILFEMLAERRGQMAAH